MTPTADTTRDDLLDRIHAEVLEAVLEGDADDCSSADCIADAVYEIVRVALLDADAAALRAARAEGVEACIAHGHYLDVADYLAAAADQPEDAR